MAIRATGPAEEPRLTNLPTASGARSDHALRPGNVSRGLTRRQMLASLAGALPLALSGCRIPWRRNEVVGLPRRHSIENDRLLVLSDVKLPDDHALILELEALRDEVTTTLALPMQSRQVVVYLFGDELRYHQYMQAVFPQLPPRRAYFVGSSKELAVYTSWGQNIREDLRHEYTHGLLHAGLKSVPLWLDEGIAEYYEVVEPGPARLNGDYVQRLGLALSNRWRPDLARLETLEAVGQMQRADYQESWAWVHYMLHSGPEAQDVLIAYLYDLRTNPQPGSLKSRLVVAIPDVETRFLNYVVTLNSTGRLVGAS